MSKLPYTSLQNKEKLLLFSLCLETGLTFDVLNQGNTSREVKGHNLVVEADCAVFSRGGVFLSGAKSLETIQHVITTQFQDRGRSFIF